ncbi:tripartite tricarboxylate transporter TctB family protein [Pseudothermotoga sp. U03pept]|uniref:tripartite tricarboxylate transporter TctB family protein n=1 Tax=Pseudothermotoga sp. U03pept TaxID=3447012 RepID=UPI003F00AA87
MQRDKITALAFIGLALFFLIGALQMPKQTEYGRYGAPGNVPVVFSTIVIVLNLVMFLRKKRQDDSTKRVEEKKVIATENKRLLVSVIVCLAYVLLLGHLNFIVLSSIFIATLSLIFYRKKPILIVVASILVTYGIYYIFDKLFLLPLP